MVGGWHVAGSPEQPNAGAAAGVAVPLAIWRSGVCHEVEVPSTGYSGTGGPLASVKLTAAASRRLLIAAVPDGDYRRVTVVLLQLVRRWRSGQGQCDCRWQSQSPVVASGARGAKAGTASNSSSCRDSNA